LEPALAETVLQLTAGAASAMQRRYRATQADETVQAASE